MSNDKNNNKMSTIEIIRNVAIVAGVGLIVLPLLELGFGAGEWLTTRNIIEWIVTAAIGATGAGAAWLIRKNI